MKVFNEQDKEIVIDIIADKLNEVIDQRVNSLHSIDILALAIDLVESFDTIFSFILHSTEIVIVSKTIIEKINKAGIPVNEEDIKEIIYKIQNKTDITKK